MCQSLQSYGSISIWNTCYGVWRLSTPAVRRAIAGVMAKLGWAIRRGPLRIRRYATTFVQPSCNKKYNTARESWSRQSEDQFMSDIAAYVDGLGLVDHHCHGVVSA